MDISNIAAEAAQDAQGVEVPIFRRDGEPDLAADGTQTTFTLLGPDAPQVRKVNDAQIRRALKARRGSQVDIAEINANRIERAVAALVGWHGVEDKGKPVPLTQDSARAVLSDRHYLEQAEKGIDEHARFFVNASVI